ncbi:MAG: TIGR04255 family protein [Caulobacterales bacterium]
MSNNLPAPLGGPAPKEVPLPGSPLVRVVAQVQLPGIIKIRLPEEAAKFQDRVRADYPMVDEDGMSELRINLGSGAPTFQQNPGVIWRFSDLDRQWRVSLAPNAVTLDTTAYTNRADFLTRWAAILAIVQDQFDPRVVQRAGIRYLDQVVDEGFAVLPSMLRHEMLGVISGPIREHVAHALSEALLATEEGKVLLRWGDLPGNVVIDPALMNPHPQRSWVLDIDSFSEERAVFEHKALAMTFGCLADRAYALFRYTVNNDFLRFYGGVL